jgi:serine/threonine protein kinase
MGEVYRAEDEALRRTVALKLLPDSSGNEEKRQRFLREARSAAAISHPNVAVVHQVGEADGRIYIAMELVEGENLRARLARGRLDLATAKELAGQIARGLAAAHDKGIVHRDLKPENVMITPSGVVKLLDFGLAKSGVDKSPPSGRTEAGLAKTETLVTSDEGRIMGTPGYMSPEQATGEPLDVRSDVFSFGIVLYEMLSGARPFAGASTGAVLVAIVRDAAPPLRQRAPEVDEATEAVVMRCLAKAPQERFGSAAEVVTALSGHPSLRATTRSRTEVEPVTRTGNFQRGSRALLTATLLGVVLASGIGWRAVARWRRAAPTTASSNAALSSAPTPASVAGPRYAERRLTFYPPENHVYDAALTRDGNEFVFADKDGFWVQRVAGGQRRPLGIPRPSGPFQPFLSISVLADGARVRVTSQYQQRTWLAPLDGSPAQIVRDAPGTLVAMSRDGTRIAVHQEDGLQLSRVDGGPVVTVPTGSITAACFSPDGSHVAFIQSSPELGLFVAAVDGSAFHRTYADASLGSDGVSGLAWPDTGRLLFTARSSESGIGFVREVAVDAEGHALSPPRELWRARARGMIGLSLESGRLSVVVDEAQDDVYIADLAPGARRLVGAPRRFTHSETWSRYPDWLPDGRLCFDSNRDTQSAIYAQAPGDPEPRLLVGPPIDDLGRMQGDRGTPHG